MILNDAGLDPWVILRGVRDFYLQRSDYTQLPDAPITPELKQAYIVYRQALRDLPSNTTDPLNPPWPIPPVE